MPIKIGSENIDAFFLGGEPIAKLMLGTQLVWQGTDPPGSVTFNTVGTHSFVIPKFATQLIVELWGAGGAGTAPISSQATDGLASQFLTVIAGGGKCAQTNIGGAGGVASGGDVNLSGVSGANGVFANGGHGGGGANGGAGGVAPSDVEGKIVGGGGAGIGNSPTRGGGGGGGAYAKKTYTKISLAAGSVITIIVGAGGVRPSGGGGNGARGEVRISWS